MPTAPTAKPTAIGSSTERSSSASDATYTRYRPRVDRNTAGSTPGMMAVAATATPSSTDCHSIGSVTCGNRAGFQKKNASPAAAVTAVTMPYLRE